MKEWHAQYVSRRKKIFEIKHGKEGRIEKDRFNVFRQMVEICKKLKNS
jgi:hypothetical protein